MNEDASGLHFNTHEDLHDTTEEITDFTFLPRKKKCSLDPRKMMALTFIALITVGTVLLLLQLHNPLGHGRGLIIPPRSLGITFFLHFSTICSWRPLRHV